MGVMLTLDQLLADRVAIVTGGARGIGRGIAQCLSQAGAHVVIADIRPDLDAADVAEEIAASGRRVVVRQVDVADPDQVDALVQETVDHFGHLDIMVGNAGIYLEQPFLELTRGNWERVRSVDLDGAFYCTQAAGRVMAADNRGGKIILISSVHAEIAFPHSAAYDVAKAGIVMLARAAACELGPHHINVNVIGPGWVETDMNRAHLADPERRKEVEATIPWGRVGQPDDVGKLVVFLASTLSDYITGTYIRCDGGLLLSK